MKALRALLLIPLLPVIITLFVMDRLIIGGDDKADRLIDAVLDN